MTILGVGAAVLKNPPSAANVAVLGDWWYNWSLGPAGITAPGFVPMAWSGLSQMAAPCMLVFNEPELADQANLTPQLAAQRYRVLRQTVLGQNPDAKFVVGGTGGDSRGQVWRDAFIAAYGRNVFRADGWHFHAYAGGSWPLAQSMIEQFIRWQEGLPIAHRGGETWLTETGVLESGRDPAGFMRSLLAYLPTRPQITRAAWFATDTAPFTSEGALIVNGQLTALGRIWAAAVNPVATPPPAPGGAVYAVADAWVSAWSPGAHHATGRELLVRTGGVYEALLRFPPNTSGVLQIWLNSKANAGMGTLNVYALSGAWQEAGVTYSSRPPVGAWLGSVPIVDAGRGYRIPLSAPVTSVLLHYTSSAMTELSFASREDAEHAPRIVAA